MTPSTRFTFEYDTAELLKRQRSIAIDIPWGKSAYHHLEPALFPNLTMILVCGYDENQNLGASVHSSETMAWKILEAVNRKRDHEFSLSLHNRSEPYWVASMRKAWNYNIFLVTQMFGPWKEPRVEILWDESVHNIAAYRAVGRQA
jgi:hypothetical protein